MDSRLKFEVPSKGRPTRGRPTRDEYVSGIDMSGIVIQPSESILDASSASRLGILTFYIRNKVSITLEIEGLATAVSQLRTLLDHLYDVLRNLGIR